MPAGFLPPSVARGRPRDDHAMRCPKCQYISFDDESRCRNCGFTFAMTPSSSEAGDLALRADEAVGPLMDLSLRGDGLLASDAEGASPEPAVPPPALDAGTGALPASPVSELPLFTGSDPHIEAGVPAVPLARPPLSVRRPTVTPRMRPTPTPSSRVTETVPRHGVPSGGTPLPPSLPSPTTARSIDRLPARDDEALGGLPLSPEASAVDDTLRANATDISAADRDVAIASTAISASAHLPTQSAPDSSAVPLRSRSATDDTAAWGPRVAAAALDLLLLATIDGLVLSLTAQIVGLPVRELTRAPLVPLVGFLMALNFAYAFSLVAAAGQTLGKMLFRLKVVSQENHELTTAAAALRAVAVMVTVLLAGIPYLFALADPFGRAPHDRLAGTRVVSL